MAKADVTRSVRHIPDSVTFRGKRYGVISGTAHKNPGPARNEAKRIAKSMDAGTIVVKFNVSGKGVRYWVAGRF